MPKLPMRARLPLAALLLLSASGMALSQSPPPPPAAGPAQPVISDDSIDDFADLNRNLTSLQEKLQKAKSLVTVSKDSTVPESQRNAFRVTVAALLTAFADGGEVAQLGQQALDFVHQRTAAAQQENNLPAAQKDAIVTRWRRIAAQTEGAVATLEATRKDLSEKLRLLESKQDFVDQMVALRQARRVLDAVGDLADQRQAVSERVKDLLAGKSTPPDM
jgi:hypothetical protein